jgi:hypothetical protein
MLRVAHGVAYRAVKVGRAVQRRRALPRRRKRRHIDIAANVFAEGARLPPAYAQAVVARGAVLAKGASERRERLRHGERIITRTICVYAGKKRRDRMRREYGGHLADSKSARVNKCQG